MPDAPCVRCGTVGFVRRERIITGEKVAVEYSCGRCQHHWQLEEDPRKAVADPPRRRSRTDRRQKS
jgi:hypothetical protein